MLDPHLTLLLQIRIMRYAENAVKEYGESKSKSAVAKAQAEGQRRLSQLHSQR